MSEETLITIILWGLGAFGTIQAFIVALVYRYFQRLRSIDLAITQGDDGVKAWAQTEFKELSEKLHDRISKVRDEAVQKDDLTGHIERFEKSLEAMAAAQGKTNERIDNMNDRMTDILAAIVRPTKA